jgi:hypothetical protein
MGHGSYPFYEKQNLNGLPDFTKQKGKNNSGF